VTLSYFSLCVLYAAFAIWGGWRLWREKSALGLAVTLLFGYLLLRTAFLTTLETPEPRYVLVCFPAIFALAGQVFARSSSPGDVIPR
jgi:4-amino-4-deoxy-L-arabinose transferase-like glycosyltransferase